MNSDYDGRMQKRVINSQALFKEKAPLHLDSNSCLQYACRLFLDNYVLELGDNLPRWTRNAMENAFCASQACNMTYQVGYAIEKVSLPDLQTLFTGQLNMTLKHLSNTLLLLNNTKHSYCIVGFFFSHTSFVRECLMGEKRNTMERRSKLVEIFGKFSAWYASLLNGACRPSIEQLQRIHNFLNDNIDFKMRYNAVLRHFPPPTAPPSAFQWTKFEDMLWWQQDYCEKHFDFQTKELTSWNEQQFFGLVKRQEEKEDLEVLKREDEEFLALFGVKTKPIPPPSQENQFNDGFVVEEEAENLLCPNQANNTIPHRGKRNQSQVFMDLRQEEQSPHSSVTRSKSCNDSLIGSPLLHSTPKRPKLIRNSVNQTNILNFVCLSSASEDEEEKKQCCLKEEIKKEEEEIKVLDQ